MQIMEYPDSELMFMDVASKLADDLEGALHHKDTVSFAVCGGTTPGPIFNELSAVHMDWDRVRVLLTDERWVPETSERSNSRLVKQTLLKDQASAAQWLPLYREEATPEDAIDAIAADVTAATPIDVMLLGMGADMHTASIFPGGDNLKEALHGKSAVVPMRSPGAPEPRITLSAAVIQDAVRRHLVIIGKEKRDALEKARKLPAEEAPVRAILRDTIVHWAEV